MHRTNAWCLSIAILFAQTIYVVKAETAADNGGAEKQVQACHIQEFGAYNAVRDIARTAGVVIGMDAVRTGEDTTYTLNFSGGTVADLLNLFVSQAPGYNWEENEAGIIHVFREDGRVSLKDVVLSYPSSANKTRKEIWESLAERRLRLRHGLQPIDALEVSCSTVRSLGDTMIRYQFRLEP